MVWTEVNAPGARLLCAVRSEDTHLHDTVRYVYSRHIGIDGTKFRTFEELDFFAFSTMIILLLL